MVAPPEIVRSRKSGGEESPSSAGQGGPQHGLSRNLDNTGLRDKESATEKIPPAPLIAGS